MHSSSGAEVHLVGVSHVSAFSGHFAYRTIKHVQPDCVVLEVDERYVELCTWLGALSNSANASPTLHIQRWQCKVITNFELLEPSARQFARVQPWSHSTSEVCSSRREEGCMRARQHSFMYVLLSVAAGRLYKPEGCSPVARCSAVLPGTQPTRKPQVELHTTERYCKLLNTYITPSCSSLHKLVMR